MILKIMHMLLIMILTCHDQAYPLALRVDTSGSRQLDLSPTFRCILYSYYVGRHSGELVMLDIDILWKFRLL